eukprot:scaffold10053_cov107-Isochrysis_galbana.AAC.3
MLVALSALSAAALCAGPRAGGAAGPLSWGRSGACRTRQARMISVSGSVYPASEVRAFLAAPNGPITRARPAAQHAAPLPGDRRLLPPSEFSPRMAASCLCRNAALCACDLEHAMPLLYVLP